MTNPANPITTKLFASVLCYVLDHLAPLLSPNATQFLCHLTRQTLGYRKEKDLLSYKRIQQLTGWCNDTIKKVIDFLLQERLIARKRCGKSFMYWLTFVDKVEEKSTTVSTPPPVQPSFFSTSPLDKTEGQIKSFNGNEGNLEEEKSVDVENTLNDINGEIRAKGNNFAQPLKHLKFLTHRARKLGMVAADLLILWEECKERATRPGGFLIWTLKGDGKPPRPIPKEKISLTKYYFLLDLEYSEAEIRRQYTVA